MNISYLLTKNRFRFFLFKYIFAGVSYGVLSVWSCLFDKRIKKNVSRYNLIA